MTGFAAPFALALGLLSIPLVLLYLLKPRREEVRVPSTFLWKQALEEVQANAPWQRLRRNLLLVLQLLILALLVLGLARPLLRSADVPGGDLVLVLDTSGSMAASDVSPSRFEEAKARVRDLAANKDAGGRVALVTTGPNARLLVSPTTDGGAITRALDGLAAPFGEGNLSDASLLARSIAGRLGDPTVVLVGDGGATETAAAPLPYPVKLETVRGEGTNAGILGLSARSGANGRELWASIANYGPARAVRVSLSMDGKLFDAQEVRLPSDGVSGVSIPDLPPGRVLEARLETKDALPADDRAWFVDAEGPPARVLLYGEESRFLERALSLVPGIEVHKAAPGATPTAGYDVYIVNGAVPSPLPKGNLLLVAPTDSALLPVRGEEEGLTSTNQSADSPILRYVDLSQTSVGRASTLAPPPWMDVLAASGDTPLLVAGEQERRKVAALAFAPEESDLPLQVAFPILIDNLMRYLRPQASSAVDGVRPGEAVTLPGLTGAAVRAPDGRETRLDGAAPAFADTAEPGVYEVRSGGQVTSRFAVNAGSERESNVSALNEAPLQSSGGAAGARAPSAGRERWWPLLALALGVLLLEWWLYNRRVGRNAGRPVRPVTRRAGRTAG